MLAVDIVNLLGDIWIGFALVMVLNFLFFFLWSLHVKMGGEDLKMLEAMALWLRSLSVVIILSYFLGTLVLSYGRIQSMAIARRARRFS